MKFLYYFVLALSAVVSVSETLPEKTLPEKTFPGSTHPVTRPTYSRTRQKTIKPTN